MSESLHYGSAWVGQRIGGTQRDSHFASSISRAAEPVGCGGNFAAFILVTVRVLYLSLPRDERFEAFSVHGSCKFKG